MSMYKKIYYKKLDYVVIEAKFKDLQMTSWRPRRGDSIVGIVPVVLKPKVSRPKKKCSQRWQFPGWMKCAFVCIA